MLHLIHHKIEKSEWTIGFIFVMIFLAFSRLIQGSDPTSTETGLRAFLEIGLVFLTFVLVILIWGIRPVLIQFLDLPNIALLALGLFALLSTLWAPHPLLSAGKSVEFLLLICSAGSIGVTAILNKVSLVKLLFISTGIGLSLNMIGNILIFQNLINIVDYAGRQRFTIGYLHPNVTADLLVGFILFCVFYFISVSGFIRRALIVLLICGSYYLLYLTDSRYDLILVLAMFMIILAVTASPKTRNHLLIFFLIGSLLLIAIGPKLLQYIPISRETYLDLLTLNGRIPLWQALFHKATLSPWFGYGYFASRDYAAALTIWAFHSHNAFLEIFLDLGLVGVAFILIFYLGMFPLSKAHLYKLPASIFLLSLSLKGLLIIKLFIPGYEEFALITLITAASMEVKLGSKAIDHETTN